MLLTKEDRRRRAEKVAHDIKSGKTVLETARKFKISRQSVYNICDRFGVAYETTKAAKKREAAEKRAKIAGDIHSGMEPGQVAKKHGALIWRVRDIARQEKITLATAPKTPSSRVLRGRQRQYEVVESVANGEMPVDVAKRFGISPSYVYHACRGAGVRTPGKGGFMLSDHYAILADLLNTEMTIAKVAEKHGVSYVKARNVYAGAREAGIKVPTREPGRNGRAK